jgi:hypothetical protein
MGTRESIKGGAIMKRALSVMLFLLITFGIWSQKKPGDDIVFTTKEWADFEAEIAAELERTALEAAEEAVKQHLIYEQKLVQEIEWLKVQNGWLKIGIFAAGGLGLVLALILVLLQ